MSMSEALQERLELAKRILKECKHPDDDIREYPVSYGYNMACDTAIRIIEQVIEQYPFGKNDYQE